MADITGQLAKAAAEQALGEPVDSVAFVALSSNHLFRVDTTSGGRYSLRIPRLQPSALSPFWQYLVDIFGLEYGTQLSSVEPVVAAIHEDGIVPETPRLVATTPVATPIGDTVAYLQTWVDGESWEPDEFPDRGRVHEQLGQYLARLHLRRHDKYGTLGSQQIDPREFVARTNASMGRTISRHWAHRPDVSEWFEKHARTMDPDVFSGYLSPIMPDISGNQFLYRADAIAAVVDLDSYVVGPRELELAIVEMCLTRPDDFRRGYEAVLPLPRFERFRAYCRFWSMLCDPSENPDLETFLSARNYFD